LTLSPKIVIGCLCCGYKRCRFKIQNHTHYGWFHMHVGWLCHVCVWIINYQLCMCSWIVLWGLTTTLLEVTFTSFFSFMDDLVFYFVPSRLCLESSRVMHVPNKSTLRNWLYVKIHFIFVLKHICDWGISYMSTLDHLISGPLWTIILTIRLIWLL